MEPQLLLSPAALSRRISACHCPSKMYVSLLNDPRPLICTMLSAQLLEEDELIWNDGVAPEACLDFDAPHVSSYEALAWWFGGIMLVYLTYRSMGLMDLHSWKKTVSISLHRGICSLLTHLCRCRRQEKCRRVPDWQTACMKRRLMPKGHGLFSGQSNTNRFLRLPHFCPSVT